jgi:hypothetical protein
MGVHIKREFYPVGQGAFYSERLFNSCRIIYDCGGNSPQYKNAIDENTKKNEDIEILFISHFHADHINGLPYLLKRVNVKKIVIPYMDNTAKQISVLMNRVCFEDIDIDEFGFVERFIIDPSTILREIAPEIDIIQVGSTDEGLDSDEPTMDVSTDESKIDRKFLVEDIPNTIRSGRSIKISGKHEELELLWELKPYNINYSEYSRKLINELSSIGIDIKRLSDSGYYDSKKNEIIKCYVKAIGSKKKFNICSMMLLSYTKCDIRCWMGIYSDCDISGRISDFSGCLYCGDADLNSDFTINLVPLIKKYIGLLQIPHHGSKYNYNEALVMELLAQKKGKAIISVGLDDKRYNHPDKSVITSLLSNLVTTYIIDKIKVTFKYTFYKR